MCSDAGSRLGIIPGAGGTQRLPRLIGRSAAKELIFTCRKVAGPQALEIGLVDHCTATGKAYEKALALAQEIAQVSWRHGLCVYAGTCGILRPSSSSVFMVLIRGPYVLYVLLCCTWAVVSGPLHWCRA
jgi:enoyl-CoA hydratase/carnithine racemase